MTSKIADSILRHIGVRGGTAQKGEHQYCTRRPLARLRNTLTPMFSSSRHTANGRAFALAGQNNGLQLRNNHVNRRREIKRYDCA
ncbi:hypothetical protein N2605_25305 [Bradyrhizobium yuanmingense]|uniref:hypothetical protein n=1 Tax=Bradyrhizobium yuanmingense TaxID=108015 RepID=UPI0021A8F5DA|nr:hypothetical protein [Bradyrhizobium sp. CB1024]UWU82889.1 hypothetical protein N2605_25305 [Bradyrhizobium sp. CB1024]